MHGGMKVYRGAAAAARHYVEADRSRADDYYLAETEPRGVVGFEVILGAYASLLSMAATGSVSLVS